MRKLLVLAAMLLALGFSSYAESKVTFTQKGTEFTQVSKSGSKGEEIKTPCTWTDSKGVKYTIYMSSKGRCYVYKISKKTGKKYKYYLPKEMDAQVAKQMK